jgi:hypothetical protein
MRESGTCADNAGNDATHSQRTLRLVADVLDRIVLLVLGDTPSAGAAAASERGEIVFVAARWAGR